MAMAKELGLPVITFSERRVRDLRIEYQYAAVFTWRQWQAPMIRSSFPLKSVLIDDLDLILQHELGVDVEVITLTEDTEEQDAFYEKMMEPAFTRIFSYDPAPGFIWNDLEGGYMETDEAFRIRIKNTFKEKK